LIKERLHGPGNNIKDLQYVPFEILQKVGDNSYKPNPPPYMCLYSVVNVENMKLYEPFILDQETEDKFLPTIEELTPQYKAELEEDTIFSTNFKTTR
jgi:hypothetical protein